MNTFAAMGLGAVIALSPLAAMAQSDGPMQVAQAAPRRPRRTPAEAGRTAGICAIAATRTRNKQGRGQNICE